MRFVSLAARAFGPFHGRSFDFAPGMNVVWGRNEAGKSSLHAALFAGLCGMRRGKGRSKEDEQFRRRHRPWAGDEWKVGLRVQLESGQLIELEQDLEGKANSRATDATLGRDLTGEIVDRGDGAPDGSRWLGLDRRSFLATACVRQAQLLQVLEEPDVLQEHLQRAVDTSGTDSTAAAALQRIDSFQKEQVGIDRTTSSKPLRAALERVDVARQRLQRARAEHDGYLELLRVQDERKAAEKQAGDRLWLLTAALEAWRCRELDSRLQRARQLAKKYPDGKPSGFAAEDELAQEVSRALQAWEGRPATPHLEGASAATLRAELEALPPASPGDLHPASEVLEAATERAVARKTLQLHHDARPAAPDVPETGGATSEELRALAATLELREPRLDPELEARRSELEARIREQATPGNRHFFFVLSSMIALASVLLFVVKQPWAGIGLLAVAALLAVRGSSRRDQSQLIACHEELRSVEARLAEASVRHGDWGRAQHAARARLDELGMAPNPQSLRDLARERERALALQDDLARWQQQHERLERDCEQHAAHLRLFLEERGVAASTDLEAGVEAYRRDCATRARRAQLEERLAARLREEERAAQSTRQRDEAAQALGRAAERCAIVARDDARVAALQRWLESRKQALYEHERMLLEWSDLERVLDGRSLEQLQALLIAAQAKARYLGERLEASEIDALSQQPEALEEQLPHLHELVQRAQNEVARSRGQIADREARLESVPDAEEELAAAEWELDRVQRLDNTLKLTREFLSQAQDEVHRSIAPVLAAAVRDWLPAVTRGRYVDLRVDPQSLQVQVCGRDAVWREAALLSHGTAEQIYLLLRVALAKHLTRRGEICPLVLDDVTVQSDNERKESVLNALQLLASERQVILFTQEDEVLAWAEAHLEPARDAILRLEPEAVGA